MKKPLLKNVQVYSSTMIYQTWQILRICLQLDPTIHHQTVQPFLQRNQIQGTSFHVIEDMVGRKEDAPEVEALDYFFLRLTMVRRKNRIFNHGGKTRETQSHWPYKFRITQLIPVTFGLTMVRRKNKSLQDELVLSSHFRNPPSWMYANVVQYLVSWGNHIKLNALTRGWFFKLKPPLLTFNPESQILLLFTYAPFYHHS